MTLGFLRPVGAAADVNELEYVSALHQTDMPNLRTDGSIRDVDIARFLCSRYGIRVEPSEVRKTVLNGFGGGDKEGVKDECIDLMEMVAILLIPTLLKAARQKTLPGNDEEAIPGDGVDFLSDQFNAGAKALQPRRGLIKYVLDMILHDVTGSRTPKRLNRDLLRQIFVSYGETELAENDDLLDEMVNASRGSSEWDGGVASGNLMLDMDTFSRVLTGDVLLYDVTNEMRLTTNYHDVFKTHRTAPSDVEQTSEEELTNEARKEMRPVKKIWTASSIDFAAGTYRSKLLVAGLWETFVITYFAYFFTEFREEEIYACPENANNRGEGFGCQVGRSIVRWFNIFFSVCFLGLLFVGLGSLGNNIERANKCKMWVGIFAVLTLVLVPYLDDRISNDPEDRLLYLASLILGCWVLSMQFSHLMPQYFPGNWQISWPQLERFFLPDGIKAESQTKQAAAHKINVMTENALDIVRVKDVDNVIATHYGQALLAFSKLGKKFEPIGGFNWTWKRVFNKELFVKEGIWIPARFLAGNFAMIIVIFYVLLSGIDLIQKAATNFGKNNEDDYFAIAVDTIFQGHIASNEIIENALFNANTNGLVPSFFQANINETDYNCTSMGILGKNATNMACHLTPGSYSCEPLKADYICAVSDSSESFQDALKVAAQAAAEETMDRFYPEERYMVVAPLIVGTCFATLTAIALTIIYIPSVTSTTLQLRSGVIPTFRDPNFGKHRFGAELVTILLGSMFWGSLFASVLVGGIFGVIVLFFVWQVTEVLALRVTATLIGITVVIVFRVLLFLILRTNLYAAFYRTRPARANFVQLALEAAHFALSVGFVAIRGVKLLLTSALYIGRIDTPFLAPGVGNLWGYFELDNYPTIFIKDILAHEAHRHPYLELLGAMYMMKLRYGKKFAKQSGSCWRLIFVYALMPWLSKYRILTRAENENDEDVDLLRDTRSSLGFMSLRKMVQLDQGMDSTLSVRELAAENPCEIVANDKDLGLPGVEKHQNILEDEAEIEITDVFTADDSAEKQILRLEEKNIMLEREVADLRRKLLLTNMKCQQVSLVSLGT